MKKNELKKCLLAGLTAGVALASTVDAALTEEEVNSSLAFGWNGSRASCGGASSFDGNYYDGGAPVRSCGGSSGPIFQPGSVPVFQGGAISSCGGSTIPTFQGGAPVQSSCGGSSAPIFQPSNATIYQQGGTPVQSCGASSYRQGQYYQPGYNQPQQGQWTDGTRQETRFYNQNPSNQGWTGTSNLNQPSGNTFAQPGTTGSYTQQGTSAQIQSQPSNTDKNINPNLQNTQKK